MAPETDEQSPEPALNVLTPIRTAASVALLTLGLVLPWNLQVGLRIAGTPIWMIALLIVVTLSALAALVVGRVERRNGTGSATLRALLTAPYLGLVAAVTLWTFVVSIRAGGDGPVPPGVGPGAWSGLAGALLAAQAPIATGTDQGRQRQVCRVIGWLSVTLAAVAALLSLYLRTRLVIPGIGGEASTANLITAVAAVFYSAVAIAPVIVVGRWIIAGSAASRLAVVMLGASTVVAGAMVWLLPVGRLLDDFHGIAQRTGTSFVGYEGYLAWTAVAAIVGTGALRAARQSTSLWRDAIRSCLLLIAVWCAGQAVLRITDIILAGVLNLPTAPYNSTALMAFNLIAAVLAAWLWVNSGSRTVPPTATAVLFGTLFVLSVCRLVLGVALVPTVEPLNGDGTNAVYGNHLAQQITSTFDIALSVLSLVLLLVALRYAEQPVSTPAVPAPKPAVRAPKPPVPAPTPAAPAAKPQVPALKPVSREPEPAPATIATQPAHKPFGGSEQKDRIAEVLAQSSQRFAAGTTYGATRPTPTPTEER